MLNVLTRMLSQDIGRFGLLYEQVGDLRRFQAATYTLPETNS